jgi:diphthine-ammonia ligase
VTPTALVSGGKDSVYATYLADSQGIPVEELLTLEPSDPESFLFHTPHLGLVPLLARAWGKAHRAVRIREHGEAAEQEALERALRVGQGPVVAGAIASSYQWSRLLAVCDRVGRRLYAPLWGKDGGRVVREEIGAGLDIRLVHLAAESLSPELAGRRLDLPLLAELERRRREVRSLHLAGEGGEYETAVVDAPFLRSRITWESEERVTEGLVTRLVVRDPRLEEKPPRERL